MLDIHDPPNKLHIRGGLHNKRKVGRCSRGSNGIFIRDDIYFETGIKDGGRCDTGRILVLLASGLRCI